MQVQRRGEKAEQWSLYGGAGTIGVDWYFQPATRLPTSVLLYHLEPGAEEGEHLHQRGHPDSCSVISEDELYLCVSGTVTATVADESVVLHPGDAVYVPEGVPHGIRNDSEVGADVVLLFGPPDGNVFAQASPEEPAP